MFSKIAAKNVKKSVKDYMIYFLTLTFGVCLFYMFNSIDSQASMMELSKTQDRTIQAMTRVIDSVSIFISVILGFLIVYANGFLIKRRKKELGIYMTLGMNKFSVSKMLVLETLIIGFFALTAGLILGVFASQGLSIVTAKMFEVNLTNFYFTFSLKAFYKTLMYFGIIFLIVMIFNTISISRLKLIDLLTASKKNQKFKMKNLFLSVIIFIVSVCCLVTAYYLIIQNGMLEFDNKFMYSIILGSIGTLLFFFSLSGFLLRVVQSNKKLYFKNLNMFILRQINAKINTTFVSMSIICIMLLITMGTLSTGMGLSDVLTKDLKSRTPYDVTFYGSADNDKSSSTVPDIGLQMKKDKIDINKYASEYAQINVYNSKLTMNDFEVDNSFYPKQYGDINEIKEESLSIITISSYNNALKMQGKPVINLKENEFLLNSNMGDFYPVLNKFLSDKGQISIDSVNLKCKSETIQNINYMSTSSVMNPCTLIVPDKFVKNMECDKLILNLNYREGVKDDDFTNILNNTYKNESENCPYYYYATKEGVYEQNLGLKTMISYLAIYIGLIFLITSTAILALQQLSEASDNAQRYSLLRKLGAEDKMINKALFTQISIYFFIPLSLAIVHSIVGIGVVNNTVSMLGGVDIAKNTVFTAVIFLVIYGGYFLATYLGSKSMIKPRRN